MKLKRVIDLVVTCIGVVLTSPLFTLAAGLVKLTSPGPVFHKATRVGRDGEPFTLLKFRTMRVGDDTSIGITAAGDPRITAVGKVLRRLKVDELPQLINVIRGEMSLVGPRPEDPRYVVGYNDAERRVLSVRPGITSPASVAFRHEEQILAAHQGDRSLYYREHVLPKKLALDLEYIERWSLFTDLRVVLQTLVAIVRPSR